MKHTDDQNYPFFAKFIWTKNKYIDKTKSNDLSVILTLLVCELKVFYSI